MFSVWEMLWSATRTLLSVTGPRGRLHTQSMKPSRLSTWRADHWRNCLTHELAQQKCNQKGRVHQLHIIDSRASSGHYAVSPCTLRPNNYLATHYLAEHFEDMLLTQQDKQKPRDGVASGAAYFAAIERALLLRMRTVTNFAFHRVVVETSTWGEGEGGGTSAWLPGTCSL